MTRVEIDLLSNNAVYPFQHLRSVKELRNIWLNKLFATRSIAEHGLGFLVNVYENKKSLKSEHEYPIFTVCFDVGGNNLSFIHNFSVQGFSFSDINYIVLSHFHYDHIGSLYKILENTENQIPILTHEDSSNIRIFKRAGDLKNSELNGKTLNQVSPLINSSKIVTQEPIDRVKIKTLNGTIKFSKDVEEIYSNNNLKIILSGEIPRIHKDEEFKNFFLIQNHIIKADKILDDKILLLELHDKSIILLGCCHSGLKNSLDYAKSITKKPISHVIGGFHMAHASNDRIKTTIEYLMNNIIDNSPLLLFPIHCSGSKLQKEIEKRNHPYLKAFNVSVGTVFTF